MSNVTIHIVIPVLIVLATRLFPTKTVLMWAPFTILPDFDFIFNILGYYVLGSDLLLHRAIFHNYFIILPTLITGVVLWRRMLREHPVLLQGSWLARWHAFGSVRAGYGMALATFFLFAHVFLDMFQGGVTPFWPFWNTYIYPRFILWVDLETFMPRLQTEFVTGTGAPTLATEYPWLTPEQIAIWLLVLIGAAAMIVRERYVGEAEPKRPKGLDRAPKLPRAVPVARKTEGKGDAKAPMVEMDGEEKG